MHAVVRRIRHAVSITLHCPQAGVQRARLFRQVRLGSTDYRSGSVQLYKAAVLAVHSLITSGSLDSSAVACHWPALPLSTCVCTLRCDRFVRPLFYCPAKHN